MSVPLALDLEFDERGFRCGAVVSGDDARTFLPEQVADVALLLRGAPLVVGHNIRQFDLPQLAALVGEPLTLSETCLLDTLELASLLWPGRPHQKLEKLYRDTQSLNDPVADCREALSLLDQGLTTVQTLSPLVRWWARRLLPDGALRQLIPDGDENPSPLQERIGMDPATALLTHLGALPPGRVEHLGALVYLHWCLLRDDPSCRRPAWVERQFSSFLAAETALGELDTSRPALERELQDIYGQGYAFKEGQFEIVQALLEGRRAPLGLLPTGGGKSLTFQFPALLLSRLRRALTVVVCPLTALMEDQVLNLQVQLPLWGERAAYLSGNQAPDEQRTVLDGVWEGRIDLLYLSPERLRNPGVQRLLRHRRPALWVLDEAHTFSQWGMDFRPDFLRIARAVREVHEGGPPPLLGMVTATATQRVCEDLEGKLVGSLQDVLGRPMQQVPQDVTFRWREEITTEVIRLPFHQRLAAIRQQLQDRAGQGVAIVYVQSRKLTEEFAGQLGSSLRAAAFHGGLSPKRKQETLEAFKAGELDVVVATNAFGMGIDREGIHTVIHAGPPTTPEAYLQEIGRVARKTGERGQAILYWDEQDFQFAFEFEKRARIGNSKNLNDCWSLVRGRLNAEPSQRWVSSHEFGRALPQTDPDDLTTQARVALYALEAYGLVQEGESQPATLHLRLESGRGDLGEEGRRLAEVLKRQGVRPGDEMRLDVRETALLAALKPSKVVTAARQMVKAGRARWSYEVSLRPRKQTSTRLARAATSVRALLEQLDAHPDADLSQMHLPAIGEDLRARRKTAQVDLALRGLAALGLARFRITGQRASLEPLPDAPPRRAWSVAAEQRLQTLDLLWGELERRLKRAPEAVLSVNAADLEDLLPEGSDLNVMDGLLALETLGIIDVARGEELQGRVFYLEHGSKRRDGKTPPYNPKAFEPLRDHYADRTRRLHAMRRIVTEPEEARRVELLRDYFSLPLSDFCAAHFDDPEGASLPQLPEYARRILDGLNETQRGVVQDDESRAVLVLAGPGSGKTRTVVHRVANLVVLQGVPPQRVLVLAYNQTAAAEVRQRLAQLIGPLGIHVDVLTFHALARQLTGKAAGDATGPDGNKLYGDAAHDWLLREAADALDQQPSEYQYVLVDEYQDVNQVKYELVRRLASFQPSDEEGGGEQPGFLVAVGDDDQNLYTFQKADIRFIRQFQQDFRIPDDRVVSLTANYRSARRLVAAANAFIELALRPAERLKDEMRRVTAVRAEEGHIALGSYHERYHAAQAIAGRVRRHADAGTPLQEIAVLAREWSQLEEVEHALNVLGLPTQRYDCDDTVRPANSAAGRHLLSRLRETLTATSDDPAQTLRDLISPYSPEDQSFAAILRAVQDLQQPTYEALALQIEAARPLVPNRVVLSSAHSAKGSEFDVVFVLDESADQSGPGTDRYADRTRALYVALTRARHQLYIVPHSQLGHPVFTDPEFLARLRGAGVQRFSIDAVPVPEHVTFSLQLEPTDLYLSAGAVIQATGRQSVDSYARHWGSLELRQQAFGDGRVHFEFRSAGRVVAQTSKFRPGDRNLRQTLRRLHQLYAAGAELAAQGRIVMRCERDEHFYVTVARYGGDETHHYLVLPTVTVTRRT